MSSSKVPPDIIQEGEKNPRGIPKAIFIVRLWSFRVLPLRALLIFSFIIVTGHPIHLSVHPSTPHPQNDVEEYLGGPDAAVERVLSAFQDALACVYLHKFALSRERALAFF